jgi:hypothetical protein
MDRVRIQNPTENDHLLRNTMPRVGGEPVPSRSPDREQLAAAIVRRREMRGFVGDLGMKALAYETGIAAQRWLDLERGVATLSPDDYRRIANVLEPDDADAFAMRLLRLSGYNA